MTIHVVKRGETLSSIAKLYSTTIDRLALENSIKDTNKISVGDSLTIPTQRQHNAPNAILKPTDESKNPTTTSTFDLSQRVGDVIYQQLAIWHGVLDALLQRLRTVEANESVHHSENTTLTKQTKPVKTTKEPPTSKHSQSNKTLNDVKQKLKEQLGKEAHVVTFTGVRLTENERKQIMAAVAVCEMNKDGFGSINSDQEFRGRKFGQRGIETGYSRIVHIGLSYGMIQFTQDSGSLGRALEKMQTKNPSKFTEIFGGGEKEISENLISLCTTGCPDLASNSNVPLSGLEYWGNQWDARHSKPKTDLGRDLHNLANQDKDGDKKPDISTNQEIRGKRVQPIKPSASEPSSDIWTGTWKQRFLDAGQITDFQEAQIDIAVNDYMNPILSKAKENNVRSALGLAFITACSVRGGPSSRLSKLFYTVGKETGITFPLKSSTDEYKIVSSIANSDGTIGSLAFDQDEARRAKLLMKDDLGFLTEDLYDTSTY